MVRSVRSRALSWLAVALLIALSTVAFWRYGFSATSASVLADGYGGKDGGYNNGYGKGYSKGYERGYGGY
ncbi:MAG TPA: hypothetical protein VNK95_16345, partial [Caldilineaceae bacterium]|nr:hypothetical protein [Caldilineaceae bacterium]